jgi:hypothetical protein
VVNACYQLARYYHQSPLHFLAMSISEVRLHWQRTNELARKMQAPDDPDG